jgi:hypothetical protein
MSTTYGVSDSWVNLSKANSQAGLIASQLNYAVDFNRTISYPGFGATVNDLQGNIVGTFTNGPAFDSSDNVKFLKFDGSNDYVSLTDFTLPTVCSVYFSIRTTATGERALFSHWSGGPVNVGYGLNNGKLYYLQYDGIWTYYTSTGVSVNTGNWVHLAFIRTSSTNMVMYVNGVQDYVLNVSSPRSLGGGNMGSIGIFWGWGHFQGDFGAMQVYNNVAHSAAEVNQQYQTAHRKRYGT